MLLLHSVFCVPTFLLVIREKSLPMLPAIRENSQIPNRNLRWDSRTNEILCVLAFGISKLHGTDRVRSGSKVFMRSLQQCHQQIITTISPARLSSRDIITRDSPIMAYKIENVIQKRKQFYKRYCGNG